MTIRLVALLFEVAPRAPKFFDEKTWEGKSDEQLIALYNRTFKEAQEDGTLHMVEYQRQFAKLHDRLGELLGSRELATMELRLKRGTRRGVDLVGLPKRLKVERHGSGYLLYEIVSEEQQTNEKREPWLPPESVFDIEVDYDGGESVNDLTPMPYNWSDEASEHLLPRVMKAIRFLHINFEKYVDADQYSGHSGITVVCQVLVSPADADRIINWISAEMPS